MPSARAFRRMLMSLDTSTTSRCGWRSCSARTTPRIWLSALPMGRSDGSVLWMAVVWNIRRPVASLLPRALSARPSSRLSASCTSESSERLTWRALRATSDMPFFWWSSSSSVIMGRKMSCSSKRNSDEGSCSNTLVSSTNSLRAALSVRARGLRAGAGLAAGRLAAGAGAGARRGRRRCHRARRRLLLRLARRRQAGEFGLQQWLVSVAGDRGFAVGTCCLGAGGIARREGQDGCGTIGQLRKRHRCHSPV